MLSERDTDLQCEFSKMSFDLRLFFFFHLVMGKMVHDFVDLQRNALMCPLHTSEGNLEVSGEHPALSSPQLLEQVMEQSKEYTEEYSKMKETKDKLVEESHTIKEILETSSDQLEALVSLESLRSTHIQAFNDLESTMADLKRISEHLGRKIRTNRENLKPTIGNDQTLFQMIQRIHRHAQKDRKNKEKSSKLSKWLEHVKETILPILQHFDRTVDHSRSIISPIVSKILQTLSNCTTIVYEEMSALLKGEETQIFQRFS